MTDPLDRSDEERYLVGLLLPVTMRSLREDALSRVVPEHFGSGIYGGMWSAAARLRANGQAINRRTLIAECHREAGGTLAEQILDSLDGYLPRANDYPRIVQEVIGAGKLRTLVASLTRAIQRAYSAEDFASAYTAAVDELEKLADDDETTVDLVPMRQVVADLEEHFKEPDHYQQVVPSPWHDFNERAAGGFHRGRLHIVGARPGDGKSVATHQAASYAAENGYSAVIFSLEMGRVEVGGRLAANSARIDMGEISRADLSAYSWSSFGEFARRSADWPLWIVDRAGMSVDYIVSTCRMMKRRHGLDVICIDYLQLLSIPGIQSREQQVSEIARRFKNLSRELDCAVLVPSQLNRDTVRRGSPSMADLRESGGIEAHADLIVLLARQKFETGHEAAGQYTGMISLDIAKNRFGRTGSIELPWRGCYASIG